VIQASFPKLPWVRVRGSWFVRGSAGSGFGVRGSRGPGSPRWGRALAPHLGGKPRYTAAMEKREALMVRVYLTEQRAKVDSLMKHLVEECGVKGITVWEAVSGVGTTPLRDDSTESVEGNPVVLEFFDHEDQAKELLERIRDLVAPRHIVMHPVTLLETPNVARPDGS